ncbi:gamma-glutamyltranspeptidase domain-containing protein [Ditylenchus destructor]|uniref:Gamma-glutamyltranspeptidase domain-containing protein n=1 Tax=Ditylenchus destructor TaxID=166010 RepID=A0AAD4MJN6_9BILA|nr:gamma-glutamyltranspeptidase domain-containing protein [Ditylenchus destructor]
MGFGSGCVEPEYGISLQNRGHGFSLKAESPNVVAPAAAVPHHHPGLPHEGRPACDELRRDGRQHAAAGPHADAGAHARLGQNPQAACDAPRWRFNSGLEINVEAAMNPATVQGLRDLGHHLEVINDSYQDFGAGQFIWRAGEPSVEGYVAASDPRRDGAAAGY